MSRNSLLSVIAVSFLISATSCASILTESKKKVTIKGLPGTTIVDKKTNATIAEIGNSGETKAKIRKQIKSRTIEARKRGYVPQIYVMDTQMEPLFWANILLGGVIGMAIDYSTGKMMTYEDDYIDLTLKPQTSDNNLQQSDTTAVAQPAITEVSDTITPNPDPFLQ